VQAGYGTMQVIWWGIDLDVRPSETAPGGANGAGKITSLKSLIGLVERAVIRFSRTGVTRMRSSDRMRQGMTCMSDLAVFLTC
jgi:branched-chain amino acid transport system ATP-binding protein